MYMQQFNSYFYIFILHHYTALILNLFHTAINTNIKIYCIYTYIIVITKTNCILPQDSYIYVTLGQDYVNNQ